MLVEHRQRLVHFLQFLLNIGLIGTVALVGNGVGGAKHHAFMMLVGHAALVADDEHRANDERSQKGRLPCFYQLLFHIGKE